MWALAQRDVADASSHVRTGIDAMGPDSVFTVMVASATGFGMRPHNVTVAPG